MHIQNYRKYVFNINNKRIVAIGLAHPMKNEEPMAVLDYISSVDNTHLLVSLEARDTDFVRQSFLGIDRKNEYGLIDIADYTAPTQEQFDRLFNYVSESNNIAIHCMAGIGRTGTMLAALALLELVSLNNNKSDISNDNIVYTSNGECPATSLVRKAISKIREPAVAVGSIETISQVESLISLEKRCSNILNDCFSA